MGIKNKRLEVMKLILSSNEITSQTDLMMALAREGYAITQATLSRDLKQMKVAKVATGTGKSIYVLPNNTAYKRVRDHQSIQEMLRLTGVIDLTFSGNLAVIRTRPGFASSIAYDIDNARIPEILGTVAGDDTIIIVIDETCSREVVKMKLENILRKEHI